MPEALLPCEAQWDDRCLWIEKQALTRKRTCILDFQTPELREINVVIGHLVHGIFVTVVQAKIPCMRHDMVSDYTLLFIVCLFL